MATGFQCRRLTLAFPTPRQRGRTQWRRGQFGQLLLPGRNRGQQTPPTRGRDIRHQYRFEWEGRSGVYQPLPRGRRLLPSLSAAGPTMTTGSRSST